jgi:hypothetical protein
MQSTHRWNPDEDALLRQLGKQRSVIASRIPNRTPRQVAAEVLKKGANCGGESRLFEPLAV